MYEVDSLNNIIWGPYNAQSQKAFRYECDHPGIQVLKDYMNTSSTSCFNASSIEELNNPIRFYHHNSLIKCDNISEIAEEIMIFSSDGRVVYKSKDLKSNISTKFIRKGLYYIKYKFRNRQFIQKIVI